MIQEELKYCYAYPRASVTADCVVLAPNDGVVKVLLIRRANEPYKDCWALPGGFMEMDETIETCAARELKEETGLEAAELTQLYTYSAVDRDPRGRTLSVAFLAELPYQEVQGGDDAAEARWFAVDAVPPLAFDHAEMLAKALEVYGGRQ